MNVGSEGFLACKVCYFTDQVGHNQEVFAKSINEVVTSHGYKAEHIKGIQASYN